MHVASSLHNRLTRDQPRFAILSGHEHKAFVPYSGIFTPAVQHKAVKARATHVHPNHLELDTKWEGSNKVPFDYLVLATGTRLAAPSMMPFDEKAPSVQYLQSYQNQLQASKHVTIVGGGAVGVQMALDLKELYPEKEVTLVHSRDALMHQFHQNFHRILKDAFDQQGIQLITNARAKVPNEGFPNNGARFTVGLNNGDEFETDFVILATGQKPNNALVDSLPTTNPEGLINKTNGFIRINKSMQIQDEAYRNIFAVGDIADTGVHKAARPGAAQAKVVASNILSMLFGGSPDVQYEKSPRAIHLSLGLKRNIIFRNPDEENGQTEPTIIEKFE